MYDDMIAYWAKVRPGAVAIVGDGATATYRDFDTAINRVARKLRSLAVPAGGLTALQITNIYGLYLVERALDRLGRTVGVISSDIHPREGLELLSADLFLTDIEAHRGAHPNTAWLSAEWMRAAATAELCGPPACDRRPEDVMRVIVSSGTTGTPKKIPITRASFARRLLISQQVGGIGKNDRLLVMMGPDTLAGFQHPMFFWAAAASVIIAQDVVLTGGTIRGDPTLLTLSPRSLASLLAIVPESMKPLASLEIVCTGGRLSWALAEKALRQLSPNIFVSYGSTEVARVALGHASVLERREGAVGFVAPLQEVQVVDDQDRPLAPGDVGAVRIRAEGLFSGYVDNEAATAATLKGGWFYPGDLGVLDADGLLSIDGRAAEIMNLGGVKIGPLAVDDLALTCPGVADAAAFSVADEDGVEQPWIAVVRGEGFEAAALIDTLKTQWPVLRPTRVAFIDRIPRTALGKAKRHRLRQIVKEALDPPRLATPGDGETERPSAPPPGP